MHTTTSERLWGRSRRLLTALILGSLVGLVPLTGASAADDPTITFNGAGHGHGVGVSQYGAYSRACVIGVDSLCVREDGDPPQSHEEILAAYFTGATLETFGDGVIDPGPIFVSAGSDRTSTTLSVHDGPGGGTDGMLFVRDPEGAADQSAALFPGDKVVVTDTTPGEGNPGGCQITLEVDGPDVDWGVGSCDVTVGLSDIDTPPSYLVEATNCTRPNDCEYGYGYSFNLVDNDSPQRLEPDTIGPGTSGLVYPGFDIVVELSLDEYILGIREVPYSWPEEAMKAMAITARSYGASYAVDSPTEVSQGVSGHQSAGCFCDVKNTSYNQVYIGYNEGVASYDEWRDAARATDSIIVYHPVAPDEGIVRGFHGTSNGGASESVVEKWTANYPYLVSVDDPWSLLPPNPSRSWSYTYSADFVVDKVWGTSSTNVLTAVEVIETNTSGSAKKVRFEAETPSGSAVTPVEWTLKSGNVTNAFSSLRSWYFTIDDSALNDPPPPPPPPTSAPVGMHDPNSGIWSLRDVDGAVDEFYYGNPLDIPFVGDWTGDGIDTLGLYRVSAGKLFLRNTNDQGVADTDIYYGNPNDVPIAGDWDGDNIDTIGIYRASDASFYLRNTNTQGIADIVVPFGQAGDIPLAGDWDGDGTDSIGVYRPSTKMMYLANDINNPADDIVFHYSGTLAEDKVVIGDWNNDGMDTPGVFRPSTRKWYLRDTYTQSSANIVFTWGSSWKNPVAGVWND